MGTWPVKHPAHAALGPHDTGQAGDGGSPLVFPSSEDSSGGVLWAPEFQFIRQSWGIPFQDPSFPHRNPERGFWRPCVLVQGGLPTTEPEGNGQGEQA